MRILVVGLSTRAIAESAARGGYDVVTLDYFGDRDQRALVENYALQRDFDLPFSAEALLEASKTLEYDAVVYTSSLENHPEMVGELAGGRQLLGNGPSVLRAVRDWAALRSVCDDEDIPYAHTLLPGEEIQVDDPRQWLRKPARGGGGHGVRPWSGESLDDGDLLQRRVAGRPASAAFVADGERSVVIGLSEQLIGREELGAQGYMWCGNILPLVLHSAEHVEAVLRSIRRAAARLTRRFGLRGVNGIDFVVEDGPATEPRPILVEVNPRYTASMELVDRAYGVSTFDLHVGAFEERLPDFSPRVSDDGDSFHGKGIIYASEDATVSDTAAWWQKGRRDIPFSGERIAAGHPICTVVATDRSREACWKTLVEEGEAVQREVQVSQRGTGGEH